jgi:acetyltransferase-like isoleucine patch superfamily enzyme
MESDEFREAFLRLIDNPDNPYHPLVVIHGRPEIGPGTYVGFMSEINAKDARVSIGANCDIASFVAINAADSHRRAIGISDAIDRGDIVIGDHVFIGSHSVILAGARIGDHTVIAAGTVVRGEDIPPFSLVIGNPAVVKPGYYRAAYDAAHAAL